MTFKKYLIKHINDYPAHEPADIYKMIYQSEFAGGHIIQDEKQHLDRLKREAITVENHPVKPIEVISDVYSRVYLDGVLKTSFSMDTLHKMIVASARANKGEITNFEKKLMLWESLEDVKSFNDFMKTQNYPLVHHSDRYKKHYNPAYRIILNHYAFYFELFLKIDEILVKQKRVVIAIDGDAGAGKTKLAALIHSIYDSQTIRMDDFFLQDHQRTPERLEEVGGNIDYERFYETVTVPLLKQQQFSYQSYNCQTHDFEHMYHMNNRGIIVIEGSYSQKAQFRNAYDLCVVLRVDEHVQQERLKQRNQNLITRFLSEWIPKEKTYAKASDLYHKADLIFNTSTSTNW